MNHKKKETTILNLDESKSLNRKISYNFEYIINKYTLNQFNNNNELIKKYKNKYYLKIKFNNVVVNFCIEKIIIPITKDIYYNMYTVDKDKTKVKTNMKKSKNQFSKYSMYNGITITFNENKHQYIGENDIYIGTISKNERQNINNGTFAIKFAIRLCQFLNAQKIFLTDDSLIECKKYRYISLPLYKLITTNTTWYGKYGFKLDILQSQQQKLDKAIKKIQKIKMKDILNTLEKFINILKKSKKTIKLINSISNNKTLKKTNHKKTIKYYKNLAQIIRDNTETNDTIKSFSKRTVENDKCKYYIDIIQRFVFESYNSMVYDTKQLITIPNYKYVEIIRNIFKIGEHNFMFVKQLK